VLKRRLDRLGHARADLVLVRDELDRDARVRGAELGGELDARGTRADDHDALGALHALRELSQFLDAIFSADAGVVGLEPLGLAALGVGGAGADDEDVVLVFLRAAGFGSGVSARREGGKGRTGTRANDRWNTSEG